MKIWILLGCVFFAFIITVVILSLLIIRTRKEKEQIKINAQSEVSSISESFENEKRALIAKHSAELASVRQECARQIVRVREEIESRKDVLSKMGEKELLTNVILALDGYACRFERIEEKLLDEEIVERVSRKVQEITTILTNMTDALTEQIDEMHISIENSINGSDLVDRISSVSSDVDDIKSEIGSISSGIDEIYTSISDKYSYDSLAASIDTLQHSVGEVKDVAESARYAAESTRDAVESHYNI